MQGREKSMKVISWEKCPCPSPIYIHHMRVYKLWIHIFTHSVHLFSIFSFHTFCAFVFNFQLLSVLCQWTHITSQKLSLSSVVCMIIMSYVMYWQLQPASEAEMWGGSWSMHTVSGVVHPWSSTSACHSSDFRPLAFTQRVSQAHIIVMHHHGLLTFVSVSWWAVWSKYSWGQIVVLHCLGQEVVSSLQTCDWLIDVCVCVCVCVWIKLCSLLAQFQCVVEIKIIQASSDWAYLSPSCIKKTWHIPLGFEKD